MIQYIVPKLGDGIHLPDHVKAGVSLMAYDGWQLAKRAGQNIPDMPTTVVGEVTIIAEHEECLDGMDTIHVLAQALGAAIHDYKGCDIPEQEREALLAEAVTHITHGIGIAHAMDER